MVLVKEVGYSLDAIRGYEETHITTHPPHPIAEALAGFTSGWERAAVGGVVVLGLLMAAATGAANGVLLSILATLLLYVAQEMNAEEQEVETTVEREGMTSTEVLSRLAQHDEHEQMKKEDAEAQARKARMRAGQGDR